MHTSPQTSWPQRPAVFAAESDRATGASNVIDVVLRILCPARLGPIWLLSPSRWQRLQRTDSAQRAAAVTGGYKSRRLFRSLSGSRGAREQALFDDGVNTPVAVDHLGDAKIDSDRNQRDRLVLSQA